MSDPRTETRADPRDPSLAPTAPTAPTAPAASTAPIAPAAPTAPITETGTYAGGTTSGAGTTYGAAGAAATGTMPAAPIPGAPQQHQDKGTAVMEQSHEAVREVADTVSEGAGDLKQAVAGELSTVTDQVKSEAKDLVHEARRRVADEADASTKQFAKVLVDAGRQLTTMAGGAEQPDNPATEIVRQLGSKTQYFGERLQREGYTGVTRDVTAWARRNPGVFLLAAGAAGFVVGRLVRNTDTSKIAEAAKSGSNGDGYGDTYGDAPSANQLFNPDVAHAAPAFPPTVVDLTETDPAFATTPSTSGTIAGTGF